MQAETTRKLIDIKAPVFNCLALKAKRKGVSLGDPPPSDQNGQHP